MRGRVSAVNSLFIGASNELGEFESGVTAAWLGTVSSVVIGGAGTILLVVLWMTLFPGLRNLDRFGHHKRSSIDLSAFLISSAGKGMLPP
jgi:hypothetical protein